MVNSDGDESSREVTSNSSCVRNVCGPDIVKGNYFLVKWREEGCVKRSFIDVWILYVWKCGGEKSTAAT